MKKVLALLLVLTMILTFAACGKKETDEASEKTAEKETQSQSAEQKDGTVPEGAVTDETKLGEAIAYKTDSEGHIVISIKTSASIKKGSGWLGICPLGVYLTEEAADAADVYYEYFDASYDKEWLDGIYTYVLNNENIEPGTYTMVLCDNDDSGSVIGEWIFSKSKNGSIEFGFDDSWLKGAGEGRNPKTFESKEKEIESWFTFNECDDEWAEFLFDGYYLEEVDSYEDDEYILFVCPEGDYSTYGEAMKAHVGDYSGIREKCPYLFSIDHSDIKTGKYTMVLAKTGGDVEIQFSAEKISDKEWKLDFENAKCSRLSAAD